MSSPFRFFAVIAIATTFAVACSNSTPSLQPRDPEGHLSSFGNFCARDSDCAGGVCAMYSSGGKCSHACSSDADCERDSSGVCVTDARGRSACVTECVGTQAGGSPNWICVDGRPTACALAGPPTCGCGCSEDSICVPGTGCMPPQPAGSACKENDQCASQTCIATPDPIHALTPTPVDTCSVPLGAACTPADCGICDTAPFGSFCTRVCNDQRNPRNGECPSGWTCLAPAGVPPT